MFSLDLSQAFDRLPRSKLHECLLRAQLDEADISVLMEWHRQPRYHLQYSGRASVVTSKQGVRQGCVAAPVLWTAFFGLYFDLVSKRISPEFARAACTAFADDLLSHWLIKHEADFHRMLRDVVAIIEILRSLGMRVNFAKSAIILHLVGPLASALRKQFVVKDAVHGDRLRVELLDEIVFIPVKTEHVYLGCVLTYSDHVSCTVGHRMGAAKACHDRLGKLLRRRRHYSLPHRVRLWQATVWPSLAYGLHLLELRSTDLRKITCFVITQLRAIASSPRHVYFETNAQLLSRLQVAVPGQAIYSRGCGTYSRWQSHLHTYPVDDCSCEAALLTTLRVVLTEIHRSVLVGGGLLESRPAYLIPADVSEAHACDVCGQYFPSEGIVQWHREHAHRVRKLPPKQYQRDFDFFEHSVDGRPECRHCRAV